MGEYENKDREEVYSKKVRAGKRTYFLMLNQQDQETITLQLLRARNAWKMAYLLNTKYFFTKKILKI